MKRARVVRPCGAAASCLGLSVGALSPSAEMALAVGPCIMVLSIMLGDESGAFTEVPDSLKVRPYTGPLFSST